jgi:hypothetical protein
MLKILLPNDVTDINSYNICSYQNKEEMKRNFIWDLQAELCQINSKILKAMADDKTSVEHCIPKFFIDNELVKIQDVYEACNFKVEMKDSTSDDPNLIDVTWMHISWEPLKEVDEDMI